MASFAGKFWRSNARARALVSGPAGGAVGTSGWAGSGASGSGARAGGGGAAVGIFLGRPRPRLTIGGGSSGLGGGCAGWQGCSG
jgi:hypothetical protein